ncbi:MAG: sulfopyruvate decarboxylase subunit alpha [Hyphomicrobiaceae bacterium]|nr:sulfopyruvate decarboxylase subunit alpha [Hyphomicrobiaceae bacterium]
MSISQQVADALIRNKVEFVTTVPCKQLAGVIELIDGDRRFLHVPSNKEDEGMGLCAGAFMGGKRACIIMQNTAIGVTINTLVTLIQYYNIPLPMLISYRGEVGEKVACQAEMAVHTKALLAQLNIPTYHFHRPEDVSELDGILNHAFMAKKPVAVLMDATFWSSAQ